jgi:acetyl esterase
VRRLLVLGSTLIAGFIMLIVIEFAMGPVRLVDLWSAAMINYQGPRHPPTTTRVYKETPTRPLRMNVFEAVPGRSGATIVLIHGGGFHSGWPEELFPMATALADIGHTVFVPEYRLQRADAVGYPEELEDCRDAVAWVDREASSFGGDPTKLVLGGSSAGAHLAAALVTLPNEVMRTDRWPLGLLLTAPYLDSTDDSARFEREPLRQGLLGRMLSAPPKDVFVGRSEDFSPRAHLHAQMPPALVLAGEEDRLWPPAREFCEAMAALGVDCVSRAFRGAGHAFALKGQAHHDAAIEEIQASLSTWLAGS